MSSIGIIVKADKELEFLPADWVPQPLGSRSTVVAAVEQCMRGNDISLALNLRIESVEESVDPRTITASGVWGTRELAIIKNLCELFSARFYDAESGELENI